MITLFNETDKRWFFTAKVKQVKGKNPHEKPKYVDGVFHTSQNPDQSAFVVPVEQISSGLSLNHKLRSHKNETGERCFPITRITTGTKINLHNMQRIIRTPHDPAYAQNLLLLAIDTSNMSELQYIYNGAQLQAFTETKRVLYAMIAFSEHNQTFGIWYRDKTTGVKKYKVFLHTLNEENGEGFVDTHTADMKQSPKGISTTRLQPYLPRRPAYLMCVHNSERDAYQAIVRRPQDVIYFDNADDLYAKMKQIKQTNPVYNAVSLFTNTEYVSHQKLNSYEREVSKYVRILRSEMDYVSRWYKSGFTKQIQVKKVGI